MKLSLTHQQEPVTIEVDDWAKIVIGSEGELVLKVANFSLSHWTHIEVDKSGDITQISKKRFSYD